MNSKPERATSPEIAKGRSDAREALPHDARRLSDRTRESMPLCHFSGLLLEPLQRGRLAQMTAAVRVLDDDDIRLTRAGVRFPIELRPQGFRADELSTWPEGDGRIEYVDGRLLFMPPRADIQQYVVADVVYVLREWASSHPGFLVGGNEAGMKLGADVRAADAAIWRRSDVGPPQGRLQHVAPVLAVEVAGVDEDEARLREKAAWYLRHGVELVWIVLPEARQVVVLTETSDVRRGASDHLVELDSLPGLCPLVSTLFSQL